MLWVLVQNKLNLHYLKQYIHLYIQKDNNLERAMDYIFNHDLETEMN